MPVEGPFILVNPERCLGCHTCELACAAAHTKAGSIIGAVLAGERLQPRNTVVQVDSVKLSTQCRQCEDAPCVKVCPTGATYRTETYTAVDVRRCIACRLCTLVCPFGAIHIEDRGRQRILHTWHTTVELRACPGCGRFFAPEPLAFLPELLPEAADTWALCPRCRREHTTRQWLEQDRRRESLVF